MSGFDSDLDAALQPDVVITVIRAFSAVLPLIALATGIALLWMYPLYGSRLRDIQQRSAELREAAETHHAQSVG